MITGPTTKADLHELVDELREEKLETAPASNFIARFVGSMDPREAALLDGLAELDRESGQPAFVADDPDAGR